MSHFVDNFLDSMKTILGGEASKFANETADFAQHLEAELVKIRTGTTAERNEATRNVKHLQATIIMDKDFYAAKAKFVGFNVFKSVCKAVVDTLIVSLV